MKGLIIKTATTCLLVLFALSFMQAQKCLKAAKTSRPTHVLVSLAKLNNFYKQFNGQATFKQVKIVKSELAYYLLASEQNGTTIFAFELETKGKKLYLNNTLPIQSCSEGELSLDTFLQQDGKIKGCRMGAHQIRQKQ